MGSIADVFFHADFYLVLVPSPELLTGGKEIRVILGYNYLMCKLQDDTSNIT